MLDSCRLPLKLQVGRDANDLLSKYQRVKEHAFVNRSESEYEYEYRTDACWLHVCNCAVHDEPSSWASVCTFATILPC